MKQMSFAVSEYVKKPKQTRKERFLQEMEHEGAHRVDDKGAWCIRW